MTTTATRRTQRAPSHRTYEEAQHDPQVRRLVEAHRVWRRTKNEADASFYRDLHALRLEYRREELVRTILTGDCQMSAGEADRALDAAELWKQLPDEELWAIVGRSSISRLTRIADSGQRRRVITTIREQARRSRDRRVGTVRVREIIESHGAVVTEVRPARRRDSKTKTGTSITIEQYKRMAQWAKGIISTDTTVARRCPPDILRLYDRVDTPTLPSGAAARDDHDDDDE